MRGLGFGFEEGGFFHLTGWTGLILRFRAGEMRWVEVEGVEVMCIGMDLSALPDTFAAYVCFLSYLLLTTYSYGWICCWKFDYFLSFLFCSPSFYFVVFFSFLISFVRGEVYTFIRSFIYVCKYTFI